MNNSENSKLLWDIFLINVAKIPNSKIYLNTEVSLKGTGIPIRNNKYLDEYLLHKN